MPKTPKAKAPAKPKIDHDKIRALVAANRNRGPEYDAIAEILLAVTGVEEQPETSQ